ncbi:hypothetical protein QBC47DRAFT_415470 [Echria macrotheca]|uniref:CFEM domain-containing protein n=1 Tax=Echria macrotheca TaxID=438768 RepID=A0AAJ0BD86_9PEZI|nr:hypothetical protein QBC47DRAFT_415470 [Echria macrotheca]
MGFLRITCALFGLCLVLLLRQADAAATAESISLQDALAALPQCAIDCLGTAIAGSGCNATDLACVCPSDALNVRATSCVTATCTIKESLTTKNITSHLCNVPVHVDGEIVPALSVFLGLAGVAVLLRILARVITKAYFWWDDLFNLFAMAGCVAFTALNIQSAEIGLGKDIWFVEFPHVTDIVRTFFINMLLYTATRFLVRSSIILFYLRVFPPGAENKLGRLLVGTLVANLVYNFSFFMAVIFQCNPVHSFWTAWAEEDGDGHCGNVNALAWVAAITGIIFDAWLLALPFPQLLSLNLHWKKKVMGSMMFSVGICVMIISLVRLKTISDFSRAVNPTKDIVGVCLWSGIELDVGVICPCLPSFRLLLRRLSPSLMGTTSGSRYEMGTVGNTTGGGGTHDRTGARKSGTATTATTATTTTPNDDALGYRAVITGGGEGTSSNKMSQDDGSHGDARSYCTSVTGLVEPDVWRRDGIGGGGGGHGNGKDGLPY